MRKFVLAVFLFMMTLTLEAAAEGILPMPEVAPPEEDIEVISLEAVTGAVYTGGNSTDDGGKRKEYHYVSYECYARFSVKLEEEGFTLVSSETLEDGRIKSVVTNGAAELKITYDPETKFVIVEYPPHVFPRDPRKYEDYETVEEGAAFEPANKVSAVFSGWEKVDSYIESWLDERYLPSKRWDDPFESEKDAQLIMVKMEVAYDGLSDIVAHDLFNSVGLRIGEEFISCKHKGRMIDEQSIWDDDDKVGGPVSFTYAMTFALTDEQLEHIDEAAVTFTDMNYAVPYVCFLNRR